MQIATPGQEAELRPSQPPRQREEFWINGDTFQDFETASLPDFKFRQIRGVLLKIAKDGADLACNVGGYSLVDIMMHISYALMHENDDFYRGFAPGEGEEGLSGTPLFPSGGD